MRRQRFTIQRAAAQLTVLSLLIIVRPGQAQSVPGDPTTIPHIGVLVHNLSEAPAATVEKAEADCREVFLGAGIRTTWINSAQDVSWKGPDIVLRAVILPKAPASRGMDVFGTALPLKTDGLQVFIYHHRVVELSRNANLPVPVILSGALLHEIGHMLLGSTDHAVAGVMRGQWDGRTLSELGQGLLRFTPEQKRQMRSNVQALVARGRISGTPPSAADNNSRAGRR